MGPNRQIDVTIRPSTGALFLVIVFGSIVLPAAAFLAFVYRIGTNEDVVAVATVFILLWIFAAGVRQRAGARGSLRVMTAKVVVGTAAWVGLSLIGAKLVQDAYPGPDYDTLSEPHLVFYSGLSVLTFVIMALLLGSVRAAAHRLRAR